MRVCAAPAYLRAAGSPQSLVDLTHHRAILYGRFDRPRSWLFPQPSGAVTEIIPPSRMHIDDIGAIRDAALDGHGLAQLLCWLIRDDVASGRLVTVLDAVPAHAFDSHALRPQTPHLPLRVHLAIDALAANLPPKVALKPRSSGSPTVHGSGS